METTQQTEIKIGGVVPFLRVTDIAQSVHFYIDGLGFTFLHKWEPDGKLQWCKLQHGNAFVMMQEDTKSIIPQSGLGAGVTLHFSCNDFDAIYREFRARGVKACKPLVGNWLKYTIITDPDGYRLFFESPSDEPTSKCFDEIFE